MSRFVMNDFFEGLAARSGVGATALRPRVASPYELQRGDALEVFEEVPVAGVAPVGEVPAFVASAAAPARVVVRDVVLAPGREDAGTRGPEEAHPAARPQPRDLATAEPRNVTTPQPGGLVTPQPRDPATREPRDLATPRTPEERIELVHHLLSPAVPDGAPELEAIPPAPRSLAGARDDNRIARDDERRQPAQSRRQPMSSPAPPAAPPRLREPLANAAEPSVVRITIGRVEVRAVQPQAPAPRPAPPAPPPGPTLEEFLEQRERRT
jgi:hypothetical protein